MILNDLPRRIIPEDSRVCPGSQFTPTSDGRCLCGQEREWHVWAPDGRGGWVRVTQEEHR